MQTSLRPCTRTKASDDRDLILHAAEKEKIVDPNTRACIAVVAISRVSGVSPSSVYDHSQSRHITISGSVHENNVSLYDHGRGCHFSGSMPNLYDYGRSTHVLLEINGHQLSGYDYGDGHHYSGTVSGSAASTYDHGLGQHFHYSM